MISPEQFPIQMALASKLGIHDSHKLQIAKRDEGRVLNALQLNLCLTNHERKAIMYAYQAGYHHD